MALKIMPLGDSITYGVVNSGYTESGGYRTELWNLFKADNFNTDFVGSISSGPGDIDKDNEGRRGWRIDQIASSVNQWLDSHQPNVVLLMIGTNDILQNYDIANAPNRLNDLIDTITNKLPNTELLVSSILPITRNSTQQQQVIDFNSYIPGIVDSKVSEGKKVSFVDIFSKVNGGDLADNVHPTINGYTKIANAWYESLKPLTGIKDTIRIQAEDMSLTNYIVESENHSALQRKLISLNGSSSSTGTASFSFSGNSGQYDVIVSYYDENDGQGNLKVKVAGEQIDEWVLNKNLGNSIPNSQTKQRRTVATGIYLNQGTFFEIEGRANQGEQARVDYIEFIPNLTDSTANLVAQNIAEETSENYTFTVTYTDNDGVDISSLDSQDVRVTGLNGFNQLATLVSIDSNNNGSPRTATYRINAPGGSWDAPDNGSYTIALQNNQVSDSKGNYFASGNLGSFQVNVPLPQTTIRIEAENMQRTGYILETNSSASNNQVVSLFQSGGSSGKVSTIFNGTSGIYDVILRYFDESDGDAILTTSIGGTQIEKRTLNQYLGNNSPTAQTAVTKTIASGVSISQEATIEIEGIANRDEFARIDYIEFVPNQTASTVSLKAQNITQETGTSYTFNVTYTDNDGVDISSLDNQDVRVTGLNGFNQLATLVSINNNNNGSPRTATYKINAPGGSWDAPDNGSYTIALQNNQVSDSKGNYFASGNLGSFQVNVPSPQTTIRIEAENMQRTGYILENNSAASNAQVVSLYQSGTTTGKVSTTFTGNSGTYDVILRYFDESDGDAILTTSIDGTQIEKRTLNQYLGNNSAISQTAVTKTIASELSISQEATIEIEGIANRDEFARVDYIEFVPVASAQSTQVNQNNPVVDELTGYSLNNIMWGTDGDDYLSGGNSDDILIGGGGNDFLIGSGGKDIFVLVSGEGADTMMDFVKGEDRFGLTGNLSYNQLMLSSGSNGTLIKVANTGELLATVVGIPVSNISIDDFVKI